MRRLFKYTLEESKDSFDIPEKHIVFKVAAQGENICVWASVDTDSRIISKRFIVVPTGAEVPVTHLQYFDTVFIDSFVLHVYL